MAAEIQKIERRLEDFDSRYRPAGLLERYARGRIAHFVGRQILTLSGAIALFFLATPLIGIVAVALVLFGEAVDCLYLRSVPRRLQRGDPVERLLQVSTVTGGLQAATIAACVVLAWFSAPEHITSAFALTYVSGAAINAGIVLPFHRSAAIARLVVFGVTVFGLFTVEFLWMAELHLHAVYDLIAVMIMVYVIAEFLGFVLAGHKTQVRNNRDLLQQSRELARANADLFEQQKEARNLALVAMHAHDSVIMSGPDSRIIWVNETFSLSTGYTLFEARGRTPAELLNGPDTAQDTSDGITAAIRAGKSHRAEIVNYTKEGRKIWVETNLVPVLDDAGQVELVIAIERDITAAKAHQAELAGAKIAAEKGERAKAQFLATMSHEIRTPMNGIIGMADLLSETDLTRENRHYVETIRRSAEALLTIINDILDFSKLDAGKPATHAVEFTLSDCIESVISLLRTQAGEKRLFIDLTCETVLPNRVIGDDGRLRQILINIIGNAIKFTNTGGVTVKVTVTDEDGAHRLHIAVADTGIGIVPDRLDHVFDEFAQADAATTRQFGGTGLGLSISRLLAREMGGDITVTSTPGKGSCFAISVLFGRASASAPVSAPVAAFDPSTMQGKVVLVAEDNRTNRLLVRKYLKDMPLTLLFANNGRQAVEMTRAYRPDIVLMDMSMPEMDGIEATEAIRADAPRQPHIIALTANVFASDKAACLSAGMNGFLTKPLRKGLLLETLAQARLDPPPVPPPV